VSLESPVIAYIDGSTRRIHLKCGLYTFDWITDIYAEYKYLRSTIESLRNWYPFMQARGGELKENGVCRNCYLVLLQGTRVVPCDEPVNLTAVGEILTDEVDDQYPFDLTGLLDPPTITLYNPCAQAILNCVTSVEVMKEDIEIEVEETPVEAELDDSAPGVEVIDNQVDIEVK